MKITGNIHTRQKRTTLKEEWMMLEMTQHNTLEIGVWKIGLQTLLYEDDFY